MGSLAKRVRAEAEQIRDNYIAGIDLKAFQYNDEARYQPGAASAKSVASLATANVLVQLAQDKGFSVQYTDVFEKYLMPPVKSDSMVKTWSSNPMQFWQKPAKFCRLVRHLRLWCFVGRPFDRQ